MLSRDTWQEIISVISRNKLRTFLTAFSVAWGIFILVILLGAGTGLRNGAQSQFMRDAMNSIWVDGGQTSIPYKGIQPGRNIQLVNEDFDAIRERIEGVDVITSSYDGRARKILSYKKEHAAFVVRSCQPDHDELENCKVISGRFINKLDIAQYRKVCAIGRPVREALFKTEDPIDKYIDVEGSPYKVVGVFQDPGRGDEDRIYIPISTAQRAYNGKNNVNVIWVSTGDAPLEKSEQMRGDIAKLMAARHHFSPDDRQAVNVYNNSMEYIRVMSMLDAIKIFIWIIGTGTIIAGIVGVGNIMMISVKERTKEIGVRKALGATPFSIVSLIMQEAIVITGAAGYIGLLMGVFTLELVNKAGLKSDFFMNPEVDLKIAITATVILVIAGVIAGLFPSLRAAGIEPVKALRDE